MKFASRIVLLVITVGVGYYVVVNREWIAAGLDHVFYQSLSASKSKDEGAALMKQGKYQEAIDSFQEALAENPKDDAIRNMLAAARQKMAEANSAPPATTPTQTLAAAASSETAHSEPARVEAVQPESRVPVQMAHRPERARPDEDNNDNERRVIQRANERGPAAKGGGGNAKGRLEPIRDNRPPIQANRRPQNRRR